MKTYIDLSHPINDHMPVYPGDEKPQLERISNFEKDGHGDFQLKTSMHISTHIDGPMHMTTSRQFIGDIFIDRFTGAGVLLNTEGEKIISRKMNYGSLIIPDSIVVIYTGFDKKYGSEEYYTMHPVISNELVQLFIEKNIKMVCIDMPSPDKHPFALHKLLLEHGILIAENLTNLEKLLTVKKFEIIALPLKINADSSPARIIVRISE